MLDARKIYRKVTSKVNDFSPEQLQNLICVVNLYRGNSQRFEETVQGYLQKTAELAKETAEAIASMQKLLIAIVENEKIGAINKDLFDVLHALDDFDEKYSGFATGEVVVS